HSTKNLTSFLNAYLFGLPLTDHKSANPDLIHAHNSFMAFVPTYHFHFCRQRSQVANIQRSSQEDFSFTLSCVEIDRDYPGLTYHRITGQKFRHPPVGKLV